MPIRQVSNDSSEEGINCSPCCDNENIRRTCKSVMLGQCLSLCLCGTAIGSQLLSNHGFNAPAAQNFLNYFFLAFTYGLMVTFRNGERNIVNVMKERGWKYFILAFVDVQANYLIVYAYQYTNIASIQLLDCFTIPVVMVLSWLFLSVRYLMSHIVGVAICIVGLFCIVYADVTNPQNTVAGKYPLWGDMLCIASTFLYGISNVSEEFLVKQYDRFEYLGIVGIFGSIIAGLQSAIFERESLSEVRFDLPIILMYLLFTVAMFIFYSMVSYVVEKTSALMFNLAVLTSDFYSLLAGIFIFQLEFNFFYFASFLVVIAGSVVYSLRKTKEKHRDEMNAFCKVCIVLCPWAKCCCKECRPKSPYTVQDVTAERSISVSLQSRASSTLSSN
uniref:Solute carrier family 35 member F2 n=1 Tax=Acrobeloides nanus TaxID=290746 RepID=A0A914CGM1_9BILA